MPINGSTGYFMVAMSGPFLRRAYLHHVVAEAFIGARPAGYVINHMDGNKQNNCAKNLEYITPSENSKHAANHIGRRKGPVKIQPPKVGRPTGENHWSARNPEKIARGAMMPHCKLSPDLVRDARARVANGEMQKTLASELGISVAQISRIIRRTRWTYL